MAPFAKLAHDMMRNRWEGRMRWLERRDIPLVAINADAVY
jgi:hypothetical protein